MKKFQHLCLERKGRDFVGEFPWEVGSTAGLEGF
jgi:hypothetical protein